MLHSRQLDLYQSRVKDYWDWVPKFPYCSNDLATGCYKLPKDQAKEHRYIQANGKYHHVIIVDCDYEDSFFAPEENIYYEPNFSIVNNDNQHTHHGYLITPVKINDWERTKPMKMLGKIQLGITRRLKGDLGFTHFLSKTLHHKTWRTEMRSPFPYTLTELIGKLDPEDLRPVAKFEEEIGLGRNCATFNKVRKWSYRAVLAHAHYDEWLAAVSQKVVEHNYSFLTPMLPTECAGLARSIAKWTWGRFSKERFSEIQSARGSLKGARLRGALLPTVVELKAEGLTQREISDHTGISQQTISNWLKRQI